jgi:hypothetical protein
MKFMVTDESLLAREHELYFERGGPFYRLMQRVGLITGKGPSIFRRCVSFLTLTWVPLFIFSVIDGRALGDSPRESFLLDFATYTRFFVAIPLLLYSEVYIGPKLTSAAQQFVRTALIKPDHTQKYNEAISWTVRLRESIFGELFILGLAFFGALTLNVDMMQGDTERSWKSMIIQKGSASSWSYAGCWFHFVAIPLLQFLYLRWVWRLLVWIRFLYAMSRLDLQIVPTHADQAGGIAFLERAHVSLGILFAAFSAIISGDIAFRIYFDGAKFESFKIPILTILIIAEILSFAPLLLFVSLLERKKSEYTRKYSHLVLSMNRKFHESWIEGAESGSLPSKENISEFSALIDLGSSFRMIRETKIILFDSKAAIRLAVPVLMPFLPLLPLVMPVDEILKVIGKMLF